MARKINQKLFMFIFNWINYGATTNISPLLIFAMTFWFPNALIAQNFKALMEYKIS